MASNITASFHHSFAGGSKNMSRLLYYLSEKQYRINSYHYELPQFFDYTKSNINIHLFNNQSFNSEVIAEHILHNYACVEQITRGIDTNNSTVLFGANLFPYCDFLLKAKSQLAKRVSGMFPLFVQPVGSDIWQIGPQIPSRVKYIIDHELVDMVFSYSESFANEIRQFYEVERQIEILPPVLETDRFYPLEQTQRISRRKLLGIKEDDFVMHHHSSMRRIKCPEVILEIAYQASEKTHRRSVLIMTGPIPTSLLERKGIAFHKADDYHYSSFFKGVSFYKSLTILWVGISAQVDYVLQLSDVELNASLHDSFNISLLEAMGCGVPVVSSDIVGIRDHIQSAGAGFCFPTTRLDFNRINATLNSEDSLLKFFDFDYAVQAVLTIEQEASHAESMGTSGAQYVVDTFSPSVIMGTFKKYFDNYARSKHSYS